MVDVSFLLDNSGHFLHVSATSVLPVKLFYIFAFDTCRIKIEDDWLIKFGCIGYTLGVLFFFK